MLLKVVGPLGGPGAVSQALLVLQGVPVGSLAYSVVVVEFAEPFCHGSSCFGALPFPLLTAVQWTFLGRPSGHNRLPPVELVQLVAHVVQAVDVRAFLAPVDVAAARRPCLSWYRTNVPVICGRDVP